MIARRYTCRTVRNMLPLHVGGDLDPRHAPRVDEHLGRCISCFRELRELGAMRGRLGVLAEQPLPAGILDGFAEEVMARIAVGEPGPAAEPPRPGPRQTILAWPRVAAAAAALLVAVAGWRAVQDTGVFSPAESSVVGRFGDAVQGLPSQDFGVQAGPGVAARPEAGSERGSRPTPERTAGLPPAAVDTPIPSEVQVLLRKQGALIVTPPGGGLEVDDGRQRRERKDH